MTASILCHLNIYSWLHSSKTLTLSNNASCTSMFSKTRISTFNGDFAMIWISTFKRSFSGMIWSKDFFFFFSFLIVHTQIFPCPFPHKHMQLSHVLHQSHDQVGEPCKSPRQKNSGTPFIMKAQHMHWILAVSQVFFNCSFVSYFCFSDDYLTLG